MLLLMWWSPAPVDAQERQQQKSAPAKSREAKSLEEERLNILRADIQRELEQYKKLKKDLEQSQKSAGEKEQERLLKVAKIYESMPAEEAAGTLAKLDDDMAVTILGALKPKSAGKILAQMESEKAAALSRKLLIKEKTSREKGSP